MPKYVAQIEGRNFLINVDGQIGKQGFFTFRYVEAADPAAAELMAVQKVRETEDLRGLVQNAADDPPVMELVSLTEVESFDGLERAEGLILYSETPRRWWQFWK